MRNEPQPGGSLAGKLSSDPSSTGSSGAAAAAFRDGAGIGTIGFDMMTVLTVTGGAAAKQACRACWAAAAA